jgi:GTP-binding protein Era
MIPAAPSGFRSGFVALIGRPNVGKSTLMNLLIGQKIAITSPVPQTTRNRLRGILTTDKAQLILVDTPGIHKPHHALGEILVKNAIAAIDAVDLVLFLVDGSVPMGRGDQFIENILERSSTPVVLGLNKIDQRPAEGEALAKIGQSYQALCDRHHWQSIAFSALTGENSAELQQQLSIQLPEGPYYYPPDLITDQPTRFIMAELIREQILQLTREEVPHSVAVTIDRVEEDPKMTRVLATVHVERASQKGILIGKGGSMMKAIGSAARQQIQKLIMGKLYLELFVKVEDQWRKSRHLLSEFGYQVESEG